MYIVPLPHIGNGPWPGLGVVASCQLLNEKAASSLDATSTSDAHPCPRCEHGKKIPEAPRSHL